METIVVFSNTEDNCPIMWRSSDHEISVNLTTHLHLEQKLRMCGVLFPFSIHIFMARC